MHKRNNTQNRSPINKHDLIAVLWGMSEATFFFIVPDVFISYRALSSTKSALRACLFALLGAVIGGVTMFVFAVHSPKALSLVRQVPAVSDAMVETTHREFAEKGATAIITAPLRGTPYKLYSVIAPSNSVPILTFIGFSVVARIWRFVIVALITGSLSRLFAHFLSYKQRVVLLFTVWIIFYGFYFAHKGF